MANVLEKKETLTKREKELHELLADYTRALQNARAQVRFYEGELEKTLTELHDVRQERKHLADLIEGMWNGPNVRNAPN